MSLVFVEHDLVGGEFVCTLVCPHCGSRSTGDREQMTDDRWYYVCPRCAEESVVSEPVRRASRIGARCGACQ